MAETESQEQSPWHLVYVNIFAGIGFGIGALILGVVLRYVLGIKIGG
jgi:hypothetical protein